MCPTVAAVMLCCDSHIVTVVCHWTRGLTRSGCVTMLVAPLTSSTMAGQGLRWGMRSLKATSSSFCWTSRTSLLNAGMERRSAASALQIADRC